jgi:hypothetical protein
MCLGQHFTGYCNAVGLCGASGNTPVLRALLVYVAPRIEQHTLLGIVVGLCGVLLLAMLRFRQHTLLGIVVGL